MEFDLDKALEDVPIHVEDPPSAPAPPPKLEKKPSESFGDLPSAEVTTLQHITKLRPKRNKIARPTRAPVSPPDHHFTPSMLLLL